MWLRYQACEGEPSTESWRSALEEELSLYVGGHFPHGVCAVYARNQGSAITITACIEDHQFQPKNFWWAFFFSSKIFSPRISGERFFFGRNFQSKYFRWGIFFS